MIKVKSSLIEAIGYDEGNKTLTVKFKRGGTYTYSEVSKEMFDDFRGAPSIGKFFLGNIKGNFPYEAVPQGEN